MLYLIRDAAHPKHAVMGIASLENCALQINDRDNFIGWTIPALKEKLQSGNYAANDLFQQLKNYLEDGISSIKWDELCTKYEIKNPTPKVVQRLIEEVNKANQERKDALISDDDEEQSELGQISLAAEKALYRKKRAERSPEKQLPQYCGDDKEYLVLYAKDVLKKEFYDYFIFAHRHVATNREIAPNTRYINLGNWIWNSTYAVLSEDGTLEVRSYKGNDPIVGD